MFFVVQAALVLTLQATLIKDIYLVALFLCLGARLFLVLGGKLPTSLLDYSRKNIKCLTLN